MARAPYTDASRYAATATATILASNLAMTIVAAVNNQAEVLGLGISPARMLKVMCTPGLGLYKWHITSPGDQRSIAEMEVRVIFHLVHGFVSLSSISLWLCTWAASTHVCQIIR